MSGRYAVWLIAIISVSGVTATKLPEVLVSDDTSREILFLDLYKRVSALEARVQMSDAVDWTQQSQFDALKSLADNQQAWLKDLDAIVRPGQCVRSKQDTKIAFFAYLSHDITNFKGSPIIVFDRVILNDGGHYSATTGPSCSKLTTSLVNDSLKFTSSDTQIFWNFLLKKCYSHFFSKKYQNIVHWIR